MLRTSLLAAAGAIAFAAPLPAHAGAFANVHSIWAVHLDGMEIGGGPFGPLSGITVTPFGDAFSIGPGLATNDLFMNQTLADGPASYDASSSGGIRITNSNPANAGGLLFGRVDAGAGYFLQAGVSLPSLESASVLARVTATGATDNVQCSTIAGQAGSCVCSPDCVVADFNEAPSAWTIPDVGSFVELDFSISIHADLVADPPAAVPEPSVPWGVPMLLGALTLPYVRWWRGGR